MVSFIIPYFNLPCDMLKECVSSIMELSLSKDEREIIIIDDGSDYSPINDLQDFRDDIIYVRQSNKGLSSARNTGLTMATGLYIQFIDSDDRLMTVAYESCLDIVRYKNPDIVKFDATDKPVKATSSDMQGPIDGAVFMRNNNLNAAAWGYIFRRDIIQDMKFTPGIYHEDEEFTPLLMLRAENVYITDAKAYYYRKREESIMTKRDNRHIIKRLNDMENIIIKLFDKSAALPAHDSLALQRRTAQLTMDYIYNTIVLTKSEKQLMQRIERLADKGLYPLPDRKYSKKYVWFRKMSKSSTGLRLMLRTLPVMAKHI
ncbi:glycosyltransferase [Prevotella sp. PMUR]|uniref:Glycosyltransferase n=1 Tax=Xylanibacter muris TaxID=2736290 RepID=A0ABX2AJE3_9BACT|nr:glycosyltransferase [Xylanibacter muris]